MVKRICIIFPDQSLTIISNEKGEASARVAARRECQIWNKGEKDPERLAMFGEIEVDLMSFKELF